MSDEPRVLFIAYHYPPGGGGGVQRSAKFVKYLRRLGLGLRVLTTRPEGADGPIPLDPSLMRDVADTESSVVRLPDPAPKRLKRFLLRFKLFRIAWTLLYPWFMEPQAFWCKAAAREGVRIAKREPVDVVYTSSAPYLLTLTGWRIKKKTGLPWVADYRDPWTDDFSPVWPSRLHYRWERRLQRKLMRRADVVVANTPEQKELYVKLLGEDRRDRIVVITNGYDGADFEGEAPARIGDGRFRIVYTGTLDVDPEKGGSGWRSRIRNLLEFAPDWFRLDTYGLKFVAAALAVLKTEHPGAYEKVLLDVYGYATPYQRGILQRHGVADRAEFHGQVNHTESLAAIRSADALLLLTADYVETGRRFPKVMGKTYEYMATRRPVLAPIPDGDMKDFLAAAGTGVFAKNDDPADIARAVADLVEKGDALISPDDEVIASFERHRQAEQLADVLRRVAGNG